MISRAETCRTLTCSGILALAENYATSKSPLARGLKVINTEKATVPMRWVFEPVAPTADILSMDQGANLWRRWYPECNIQDPGRGFGVEYVITFDRLNIG